MDDDSRLKQIRAAADAVAKVTGFDFDQLRVHSREQKRVFARMSFSHLCLEHGLTMTEVGRLLDRSFATVRHMSLNYGNDLSYCPAFKRTDEEVRRVFNKIVFTL